MSRHHKTKSKFKPKSPTAVKKTPAVASTLAQSSDIANWLQEGFALHRSGRLDEAKLIYERILQEQSNHFDALQLLATAYMQQKNAQAALMYFDKALQINQINAVIFNNRGNALRDLTRLDEALKSYDEAICLKPDFVEAYYNRGNTLKELKRFDEALKSYEEAIGLKPDYADAHYNRGVALQHVRRLDEALKSYHEAIRYKPNFIEAYSNIGNTLQELKRLDEALKSYDEAIRIKPDYADAYNNRGNVLKDLKRLDEALKSYDEALRLKSDFIEAHNNRGLTLQELKRFDDSLKSYDEAIHLKPDYAEAYNNRALTLQDLEWLDEALECYDEAIRLKPDFAEAYLNRGNVLQDLKRLGEAVKSYDQALRLKPDYEFLFGTRLNTQMKLCDWTGLPEQLKQLDSLVMTNQKATVPFPLLALTDNPIQQLLAAQVYIQAKHPVSHLLGDCVKRAPDGKIRIGYYSADFHNHATSYLISELFEAHDARTFELYGFSYGPNTGDEMRKRVSKGFRQFVDVSDRSDLDIAKLSRELGIDIAVDLKGFTQDTRIDFFAMRCAPIQVNYLGYPGTMGAPYIDYIVADSTLIPQEHQRDYTEKIVYMPHSYQVNDSTRKIADRTFTRTELGLPEEGFVFCCFNNNYKILPDTFDVWMRLLAAVKGSVLWLFEDNSTAAINLRREAELRGVDASRLVFAKRMKLDEHLARHRVADLFIDTFPYNAHTTASDSLWAGLPVLTLMGQSFASRVAASLLNALDLSELITLTQDAYEARAIELAMNPDMLEQIKAKLHRNRLTSPLFDGHTFAKHLEVAYSEMYSRYALGLAPSHIVVQP
jgi:protein O-GlcNAc transferase